MTRTRRTIAAALPLLAATLGVSAAKETPIIIDELYDPLGGDGPIPAICNATSCNFFFLCNRTSDPSDPTTSTGTHCGQVDASPAMPAILFLPANRATLQAYINYTQSINLYSDDYCQGFQTNHPTLGSCADQGYKYKHANEPGREIQWAGRWVYSVRLRPRVSHRAFLCRHVLFRASLRLGVVQARFPLWPSMCHPHAHPDGWLVDSSRWDALVRVRESWYAVGFGRAG